jgi:hypothetical protein
VKQQPTTLSELVESLQAQLPAGCEVWKSLQLFAGRYPTGRRTTPEQVAARNAALTAQSACVALSGSVPVCARGVRAVGSGRLRQHCGMLWHEQAGEIDGEPKWDEANNAETHADRGQQLKNQSDHNKYAAGSKRSHVLCLPVDIQIDRKPAVSSVPHSATVTALPLSSAALACRSRWPALTTLASPRGPSREWPARSVMVGRPPRAVADRSASRCESTRAASPPQDGCWS